MRGSRVKSQRQINLPTCTVHTCSFVPATWTYKHQTTFICLGQCYGFSPLSSSTTEAKGGRSHTSWEEQRETLASIASSDERGKTQPQRKSARCHIPLTNNSTVADEHSGSRCYLFLLDLLWKHELPSQKPPTHHWKSVDLTPGSIA